tara:strand:- start:3698 stop:3856 length:159 start_codon:yes stop_codon:yes gene_type:complete
MGDDQGNEVDSSTVEKAREVCKERDALEEWIEVHAGKDALKVDKDKDRLITD